MNKFFIPPAVCVLLAVVSGCHRPVAAGDSEPEARVVGDRIALPEKSPAIPGIATQPAEATAAAQGRLNGRLTWNDDLTVRVFAPVAGRVEKILVDLSQRVRPGDALALIASPEYAQARADVLKARVDFALADRSRERLRTLAEHGAAAQKDLLVAEADFERARSEKDRAESALRMRGGADATDDQTFALKTPIEGVVVEKNLTPGQEVRADQMLANAPQFFAPLFTISDPTHLWVMVDASERDLAALRSGTRLTVRSTTYPERGFEGQVDWVSDALDPNTRMVKVRGRVDNPDRTLKAEMFVSVEFESPAVAGVDVPVRAVLMHGDQAFVYVEEKPGAYQRRAVQLGGQREAKITVLDGVRPGERVVIENNLLLEKIRAGAAAQPEHAQP